MARFNSNSKWTYLGAFGILFLALVLRMSYFGFDYYCQLDDYIHFRQYPEGYDFVAFCIEGGYFASRPFAVLSDFWIWGQLEPYTCALAVAFMYALSGVLFWKLFRKHFSTGWFFVALYALLPLGFEGTYWLAASTRIIPPLMFTSAALLAFDSFCETKKAWFLVPFLVFSLASYIFYEQLLVLSLALSLMLMILHLLYQRSHALWGLMVFIPVAIYVAFTGYFSSAESGVGSRMNVILPTDPTYFSMFLPELLDQMFDAFIRGGFLTLGKGFVRGVELIFTKGIWAAVLIPAVMVLFFLADKKWAKVENGKLFHIAPVFGFLAALAPVTPFFIIANPWFSLRNTAASFLGVALLGDYLLRLLLKNKTAAVTAIFAGVCLVASVSELYDYKLTTENNEKVVQAVIAADEKYDLNGKVGILGLNESYLEDQNYKFHDHVIGTHASDWALEGAIRYFLGTTIDYDPCPLSTDGEYYWVSWNRGIKDVKRFDQLLYYDHQSETLELLILESFGQEDLLYDTDGILRARIWEDQEGYGRVEIYGK